MRERTGAGRAAAVLVQDRVDAAQRRARDERAHLVSVVTEASATAVPPRLSVLDAATRRQHALAPRRAPHGRRVGARQLGRQLDERLVCDAHATRQSAT